VRWLLFVASIATALMALLASAAFEAANEEVKARIANPAFKTRE
jgi:hypothetical protein